MACHSLWVCLPPIACNLAEVAAHVAAELLPGAQSYIRKDIYIYIYIYILAMLVVVSLVVVVVVVVVVSYVSICICMNNI